jgi:hypothetical protein
MEQIELNKIFMECIKSFENVERDNLDFSKLLKSANPFTIFDDMTPDEVVDMVLFKHKETSEETIRGNLLECCAIKINNRIQGGIKSKVVDVDLEIPTENFFYGIKNSPNWGNANQQTKVGETNQKLLLEGKNFAILTLYGKTPKRRSEKFPQYGGQMAWDIIGNCDSELYIKVHCAFNENKVTYRQFIQNIYIMDRQKAISWFIENFVKDNKINLEKINKFISGKNKINVTKW